MRHSGARGGMCAAAKRLPSPCSSMVQRIVSVSSIASCASSGSSGQDAFDLIAQTDRDLPACRRLAIGARATRRTPRRCTAGVTRELRKPASGSVARRTALDNAARRARRRSSAAIPAAREGDVRGGANPARGSRGARCRGAALRSHRGFRPRAAAGLVLRRVRGGGRW